MKDTPVSGLLLIALLLLIHSSGFGQDENDHEHFHKNNELSIGAGVVFLPVEEVITSGYNFHYVRGIGHENKFGLGLSLETILDEHKHIFLAMVTQFNAYKGLKLSYSPGILFSNDELNTERIFAHHVEITYEFEVGWLHIGPVIGIGQAKNDWHILAGVHGGIDF